MDAPAVGRHPIKLPAACKCAHPMDNRNLSYDLLALVLFRCRRLLGVVGLYLHACRSRC